MLLRALHMVLFNQRIIAPSSQHKLLIFFYLPTANKLVQTRKQKKKFIAIVKIDKSNLEHNAYHGTSDNDKLSIRPNTLVYNFFLYKMNYHQQAN